MGERVDIFVSAVVGEQSRINHAFTSVIRRLLP